MKLSMICVGCLLTIFAATAVQAENYIIDTKGAHAAIQFRIKHLGYSWLVGRFNRFDGHFTYDKKHPEQSKITVNIDTRSVDSNHAERDKHLRDFDFLWAKKHPAAKFVSSSYDVIEEGKASVKGQLSLRGVTQPISIEVKEIGHGLDPWGGYRRGFEGTASIKLKDFDIIYELGAASQTVELYLYIEGIRQ